ncbi:tetratricopeptide repeat protein [Massilia sp. Dwa41.01b]|uniref:tetratricopeptide repeat protein n=1 Tax=Massilia sp. Dwa41.01b TaxID=2709302 RepID=UPI0016009C50|nr:tetratricopeptide repeat protein [Massilia sp. Dwa41.01b]QNA89800.1 tetratricopeptide repeat protein [Massilia sp. Dwa41.01b]
MLLARELLRLGELYRQGGACAARAGVFPESCLLRQQLLGERHPDTRAGRAALAAALRDAGQLHEARQQYELLLEHCLAGVGPAHPETLAARSGLAATLARLDEFAPALALHDEVIALCERQYGPGHIVTLDALAGQARTLAHQGEYSRARMLYERVLEGRQRVLGTEHEDTLRCTQQLATLLRDMGDLGNARKLQENVVRVRERQAGIEATVTLQARARRLPKSLPPRAISAPCATCSSRWRRRARRLGSDHPDTTGILLRLASTLSQQGELEEARRLQQHVVNLHERLRGMDDHETLRSKQMLAQTLSSQGHSLAARRLEQSVEEGGSRLRQLRAMSSGLHDMAGAGFAAPLAGGRPPAPRGTREPGGAPSTSVPGGTDPLEHKLGQLHKLVEGGRAREARVLADSLRESILRPTVARPLRRRGVALIKQVYLDDGDKDALLAFAEDEVAALEGALIEAAGGRPLAMR